jgi:hypothetical protein
MASFNGGNVRVSMSDVMLSDEDMERRMELRKLLSGWDDEPGGDDAEKALWAKGGDERPQRQPLDGILAASNYYRRLRKYQHWFEERKGQIEDEMHDLSRSCVLVEAHKNDRGTGMAILAPKNILYTNPMDDLFNKRSNANDASSFVDRAAPPPRNDRHSLPRQLTRTPSSPPQPPLDLGMPTPNRPRNTASEYDHGFIHNSDHKRKPGWQPPRATPEPNATASPLKHRQDVDNGFLQKKQAPRQLQRQQPRHPQQLQHQQQQWPIQNNGNALQLGHGDDHGPAAGQEEADHGPAAEEEDVQAALLLPSGSLDTGAGASMADFDGEQGHQFANSSSPSSTTFATTTPNATPTKRSIGHTLPTSSRTTTPAATAMNYGYASAHTGAYMNEGTEEQSPGAARLVKLLREREARERDNREREYRARLAGE